MDILRENLERKFSTYLKNKGKYAVTLLEIDYIRYIGEHAMLGKIVKDLLSEGLLPKASFEYIYELFMHGDSVRRITTFNEYKLAQPSFHDSNIEEKYGVYKEFIRSMHELIDAYYEAKKMNSTKVFKKMDERRSKQKMNTPYVIELLHNHILERLPMSSNLTTFNESGILNFSGKNILISRSKNSDHYCLLKTIFSGKEKLWSYDEIAEDWGYEYDKNSWKKYYQAGHKTNNKIAQETTIKDFLELTNKTVNINKKNIKFAKFYKHTFRYPSYN